MFSDQPSVSLVSNGAECVVISKQLFLEHAPEHLIHQIRLSVSDCYKLKGGALSRGLEETLARSEKINCDVFIL